MKMTDNADFRRLFFILILITLFLSIAKNTAAQELVVAQTTNSNALSPDKQMKILEAIEEAQAKAELLKKDVKEDANSYWKLKELEALLGKANYQ